MTQDAHSIEDLAEAAHLPVVADADLRDNAPRPPKSRAYGTNDIDFIAHLIAHKNGYAQTRQRRRVSNQAAQNAYGATMASTDKRMPVGYSKNSAA